MDNLIVNRENEVASIQKLSAQREIYSRAKILFIFRTILSVFIIVILSFIQLLLPKNDITIIIATYSIFVMFVDFFLEHLIQSYKEKAAKIQESFDTFVLDIGWNNILIGERPEYETIFEYSEKHKKKNDLSNLVNWYSVELKEVAGNAAKIICQKSNCNYDISVRKNFNMVFFGTCVISLIILFATSIWSNITTSKLILTFLFPACPIMQWTYKNFYSNVRSIKRLTELNAFINNIWDRIKNSVVVEDSVIREIQDGIYLNRLESPLMPNYIYEKLRPINELKMNYTVKELVEELLTS